MSVPMWETQEQDLKTKRNTSLFPFLGTDRSESCVQPTQWQESNSLLRDFWRQRWLWGIKPVTCQLQEVSDPPSHTHTHISTSLAPCCCLRATPAGSGSAGEPGGIVDRLCQINTRTGKCAKEEKSSTCSVVRGDYGVDRFSVKQYNSGFFFPLLFSSLPHFLITCRPGRDTFLWQRYFDKSAKYSNGTFVYNFHCFLTFFHFYLHVAFIPSLFPFFIFLLPFCHYCFLSLLSLPSCHCSFSTLSFTPPFHPDCPPPFFIIIFPCSSFFTSYFSIFLPFNYLKNMISILLLHVSVLTYLNTHHYYL